MTPRERTEEKLQGVHPDLVAVVRLALTLSPVPFIVTEGVRSLEKQKKLFELGATRTLKSRGKIIIFYLPQHIDNLPI